MSLLTEHASPGTKRRSEAEALGADMFGGSRSYGTIAVMLSTLKSNEEILKHLKGTNGAGKLERKFGITSKTAEFQFNELKAEGHDALNELGTSVLPELLSAGRDLVGVLRVLVHGFDALPPAGKKIVADLLIFSAVLSPVAFLLGGLSSGLGLLSKLAKGLLSPLTKLAGPLGEAGTEAGAAEAGLGTLAGFVAPGAALFIGLEALNRALGGHRNIFSQAYHGGKDAAKPVRHGIEAGIHDALKYNPITRLAGLSYTTGARNLLETATGRRHATSATASTTRRNYGRHRLLVSRARPSSTVSNRPNTSHRSIGPRSS